MDMEEFLPAPRSLCMAEQDKPVSLQESLVGAFSQFQVIQQRKPKRQVLDIMTWVRYFSVHDGAGEKVAQ